MSNLSSVVVSPIMSKVENYMKNDSFVSPEAKLEVKRILLRNWGWCEAQKNFPADKTDLFYKKDGQIYLEHDSWHKVTLLNCDTDTSEEGSISYPRNTVSYYKSKVILTDETNYIILRYNGILSYVNIGDIAAEIINI